MFLIYLISAQFVTNDNSLLVFLTLPVTILATLCLSSTRLLRLCCYSIVEVIMWERRDTCVTPREIPHYLTVEILHIT